MVNQENVKGDTGGSEVVSEQGPMDTADLLARSQDILQAATVVRAHFHEAESRLLSQEVASKKREARIGKLIQRLRTKRRQCREQFRKQAEEFTQRDEALRRQELALREQAAAHQEARLQQEREDSEKAKALAADRQSLTEREEAFEELSRPLDAERERQEKERERLRGIQEEIESREEALDAKNRELTEEAARLAETQDQVRAEKERIREAHSQATTLQEGLTAIQEQLDAERREVAEKRMELMRRLSSLSQGVPEETRFEPETVQRSEAETGDQPAAADVPQTEPASGDERKEPVADSAKSKLVSQFRKLRRDASRRSQTG